MFDTEKFITEIEKRPVLWIYSDKTTAGDRELKQKVWEEVGAVIYRKWDLFSDQEKFEKGKILYKKWRNIRDYFVKELRTQRKRSTGMSTAKHKKYVYFDMLRFLTPVYESKRTEGGVDFPNSSLDNPLAEADLEHSPEPEFIDLTPAREETTGSKRYSHEEGKKHKSRENEEIDADKAFFISLLPAVKKLNDQQKLDLKLEVLQALKKIQNPNFQPSSGVPLYYQCAHCQSFTCVTSRSPGLVTNACSSTTSQTVVSKSENSDSE